MFYLCCISPPQRVMNAHISSALSSACMARLAISSNSTNLITVLHLFRDASVHADERTCCALPGVHGVTGVHQGFSIL